MCVVRYLLKDERIVWGGTMPKPKVRKGMPSVQLTKEEFSKRAREDVSSAILNFPCPSNGSKRAAPSSRRKNVRRVPNPIRAFFSSTAPPAATKPVQEKCRKLFVWRK